MCGRSIVALSELSVKVIYGMKKRFNIKNILGALGLLAVLAVVSVIGYRVVLTSAEIPGKLSSVSVAAANLNYYGNSMEGAQKVGYNTMKYGYMDGLLLAQMDYLDKASEDRHMDEIRAIKDLTAMSERTADKLAYEQLKAQREAEAEKARQEAKLAEEAKRAEINAMVDAILHPSTENIDTGDSSDTGSGDTASRGGKKGKPVYASTHGKSLGQFVITAYCTCKICCGIYSGNNRTASGTVPTSNRTIAVDTNVIPFGTKVVINGQVYVAEDRGGAIKGKRIDMFYMTHKEALKWGKRKMEVFLAD